MADRPARSIEELETLVRRFLRDWEDSDSLPSEAARVLVAKILSFERIQHALGESLAGLSHCEKDDTGFIPSGRP